VFNVLESEDIGIDWDGLGTEVLLELKRLEVNQQFLLRGLLGFLEAERALQLAVRTALHSARSHHAQHLSQQILVPPESTHHSWILLKTVRYFELFQVSKYRIYSHMLLHLHLCMTVPCIY